MSDAAIRGLELPDLVRVRSAKPLAGFRRCSHVESYRRGWEYLIPRAQLRRAVKLGGELIESSDRARTRSESHTQEEPMERTPWRARINLSVTTKGIATYEVTGEAGTVQEAQAILDGAIDAARATAKAKGLVVADDYAADPGKAKPAP